MINVQYILDQESKNGRTEITTKIQLARERERERERERDGG